LAKSKCRKPTSPRNQTNTEQRMKRSFEQLRAKLQAGDAGPSPFTGAAAAAGSARVPARSITLPATNKIDHAYPTITGFVVNAKPNNKVAGLMSIEMLAMDAYTPDSASNGLDLVFDLPSGKFTPATIKCTTDDPKFKLAAKPHRMADKFVLFPLTGLISFDVKTKGQGQLPGSDLTVADLPPGKEIEVMRFYYEMRMNADGSSVTFCNADTISYLRPGPFVSKAHEFIVDKAFSCPGLHREVVMNVARFTAEYQQEALFQFMKKDAEVLKEKVEGLRVALSDCRVGQGMSLETDAISETTAKSMKDVVELCDATGKFDSVGEMPPNAQCDIIDLVARLAEVNLSRFRKAPFLQSAIDPGSKKLLDSDKTGVGPRMFDFCCSIAEGDKSADKFGFFTESLFSSTKTAETKSIGAFEIDVKAVAMSIKNPVDGQWTHLVPQLKSGESVCVAQILISAGKNAAPNMQIFDYARLPLITNAVLPCSAIMATTPALALRATKCTDVQPLISGSFESGFYPWDNIYDFTSGITHAGVMVSGAFLKEHLCDDSEDFFVHTDPATLFAYSQNTANGGPAEPAKVRIEANGRVCLNSFPDTRISKFTSTKSLPTNAGGINFYAIFPEAAQCIIDNQGVNTDAKKGDAALKKVLDAQNDVASWRTSKLAIYAIAHEKEGSETTEAVAAETEKKQKVAVEDGNDSDDFHLG